MDAFTCFNSYAYFSTHINSHAYKYANGDAAYRSDRHPNAYEHACTAYSDGYEDIYSCSY
jgi:hypothetical protein